jgi:hypothetical protein
MREKQSHRTAANAVGRDHPAERAAIVGKAIDGPVSDGALAAPQASKAARISRLKVTGVNVLVRAGDPAETAVNHRRPCRS